jgi:hypothetical protein
VTSAFVNQPGTTAGPVSRRYEERFYPALFNDFVARIRWAERGTGNRNPVVVINGDATPAALALTAEAGASLTIDASVPTTPIRIAWISSGGSCRSRATTVAPWSLPLPIPAVRL